MNGNWGKIILFSLLFLVLGFILGRLCGNCGGGKCGPGGMHGGDRAMHGGHCGEGGGQGKCCNIKGGSQGGSAAADSLSTAH